MKKDLTSSRFHEQDKVCFTLIELLVVIAIIASLAGMLLPALNAARNRARTITCSGNLKSISQAMLMYIDNNNEWMFNAKRSGMCMFWRHYLASYVGYKLPMFNADGTLNADLNVAVRKAKGIYYCPSVKTPESLKNDSLAYSSVHTVYTYGMGTSNGDSAKIKRIPGK